MTFVFLTNYMTHHQLPLYTRLREALGEDLHLIVTDKMEKERVDMGWSINAEEIPGYMYMDDDVEKAEKLIRECDVVLCGGADDYFLRERLDRKAFTLRYYERLFKDGYWHAFTPKAFSKNRNRHVRLKNDPVYLLCAGAYVAHDFNLIGAYPDKKYKWGYFTEFIEYDEEKLKRKYRGETRILWTGRLIDWKHPEHAVYAAAKCVKNGYDITLTMIGEGEESAKLDEMIKEYGLEGCVIRRPFIAPSEVREEMLRSDIYLCTSDFKEGWGAVVNEAMNAGCAVVGSSGAGAVPFLLKHEVNGLVYPSGEKDILAEAVFALCDDPSLRARFGLEAYRTIASDWNPGKACKRLLKFCEAKLEGRDYTAETGPMSKAEVIRPKNGWMSCL
ncbi:MAG: glycosyltransferase [Lachnospiraceae bacterium]|nr:glycosyltransferase [Lachnospiraceae bacterium]